MYETYAAEKWRYLRVLLIFFSQMFSYSIFV